MPRGQVVGNRMQALPQRIVGAVRPAGADSGFSRPKLQGAQAQSSHAVPKLVSLLLGGGVANGRATRACREAGAVFRGLWLAGGEPCTLLRPGGLKSYYLFGLWQCQAPSP